VIPRQIAPVLRALARKVPVVTVFGPRQSGKTVLCRAAFPRKPYANLEAPDVRQFALEDPRGFLRRFPSGALLDEVQRAPELLSYIQAEVDERRAPGRYVLTGSQQWLLSERVSQSLAGRTALLRLLPFSLAEMRGRYPAGSLDETLLRGFYPRIHDARLRPAQALADYVETYVQRDLRLLANVRDLSLFVKFLGLLAGRAGQLLNLSQLAGDAGVSHTTARQWLSLLEAGFIVHLLPPWFANLGKRLVKAPKLYFVDVGLACYLLGITAAAQLARHPLRGALVENLVVIEALKAFHNRGLAPRMHFYRDSNGNEVDLLLEHGAALYAVEVKAGATVAPDFVKGLAKFSGLMAGRLGGGAVVYGGESAQQRGAFQVEPALACDRLFASWLKGCPQRRSARTGSE
jgi:predicted AAA+ superfamily ATPase